MMRTRLPAALLGAALLGAALGACADEADETAGFPPPPEDSAVQDVTSPDVAEGPVTQAPAAPAEGALVDPNTATREELVAGGVDPATADALVAGRPYADMVAVDRALAQSLDEAGREALYARVWMPLDLNAATAEEILLIPGVGERMRHEFEEYRPYRGIEEFRREIGKYVDEEEVARLERYVRVGG